MACEHLDALESQEDLLYHVLWGCGRMPCLGESRRSL